MAVYLLVARSLKGEIEEGLDQRHTQSAATTLFVPKVSDMRETGRLALEGERDNEYVQA
jgi:hypothetical protein